MTKALDHPVERSSERARCGLHPAQREIEIDRLLKRQGFVPFGELCARLEASRATVRRDLERMALAGTVRRVRGGIKPADGATLASAPGVEDGQRDAIAAAAAGLLAHGEAIIIDGGGATDALCHHLDGLDLQVLTNSLAIAGALSKQIGTRVMVPGGSLHPKQGIIVDPFEGREERFRGSKVLIWAEALGAQGLMQSDPLLIRAEQKLMHQADELIVLAEPAAFSRSACFILCALDEIDVVVTSGPVAEAHRERFEQHGVRLVVVDGR
jgi:DeoR family ulaG and ulaABCDEF operon transcriptional repressor